MPKKELEQSYYTQCYYTKHRDAHIHHDHKKEDQGMYISEMNGKEFEVDKDVKRSKKIKPSKIFQNYSNNKRVTSKKKKKEMDKPQPIHLDNNKRGTYKL